ncbi:MAG: AMP-binding protein, partial [Chloroflexi bacterium]|nr:AMP-binding protein [Chloroflexota bacterium]
NSDDFLYAYFGILLARGVPAPIAPIRRLKTDDYYLANVARRLQFIHARILIVPEEQAHVGEIAPLSHVEDLTILTRREVPAASRPLAPDGSSDDLGLFQFTSGTSGNAKAVQLTHAALLNQAKNISLTLAVDAIEDSGLSWLPLFHDMGLIGFLLTPAFCAMNTSLLRTEDFMMRPSSWIQALSDLRISITGGPPSAYALCARHLKDSEIPQYNLRHLRIALVGAEVISPGGLQQFADRLQPAGFRAKSLLPAYGLAENGLSVTMTALEQGLEFDTVDLEAMQTKGIAQAALHSSSNGTTRAVVSVGTPLPQSEVAIVNEAGEPLGERQVGEILVRSPSLMLGYYGQSEASQQALRNGWLWTGDLGYIVDKKLHVTGRKKEILIVGGNNYYPDDLEQVVVAVSGVRPGCAVAIACEDAARATEAVVVLVETTISGQVERDALRLRIRQALIQAGYSISEVVLLRPKTIQTTLNGKLKRVECKARYLRGEFSHDNETSKSG